MKDLRIPEEGRKVLDLRRARDEYERNMKEDLRFRLKEAVKEAYQRGQEYCDVDWIFSTILVDKETDLPITREDREWLEEEFSFQVTYDKANVFYRVQPTEELKMLLTLEQKRQDEEIRGCPV